MKKLAGWILTVFGLIFMISIGLEALTSLVLDFSGKANFVLTLEYIVVTAIFFFVWKYGGKLRSDK